MIVGDPAKRERIAQYYREAFDGYRSMPVSAHALAEQAAGDDVATMKGVVGSAEALAFTLGTDFKSARGRDLAGSLHVDGW
jgi:hypothetical protein